MKYLYLILLITCPIFVYGQDSQYRFNDDQRSQYTQYSSDTMTEGNQLDTSSDQKINRVQFDRLINSEFTRVLDANNSSNLGTFAALDTDKSKINYSLTFIPGKCEKGKTAVTLSLEGSNSDNILPIFSKDDFAKQLGVGLQIHHMLDGKNKDRSKIRYLQSDLNAQQKNEDEINMKYDESLRNWILDISYRSLNEEIAKTRKEVQSLKDTVLKWRNELKNFSSKLEQSQAELKIDKVIIKIERLEAEIARNEAEIETLDEEGVDARKTRTLRMLMSERAAKVNKAREELKLKGFKVRWVSFGVMLSNNTFKLFDMNSVVDQQIMDTSYFTKKISFSLSEYNGESGGNRYLWSAGFDLAITDNFDSFSAVNIQSRTNFDNTDPNAQFTITETDAYQGDDSYEQGIANVTFRVDYYRFLFKGKTVALHSFPRLHVMEGESKNTMDFGIGIFTALPKKGDEASSVNAELFYNFVDVSNAEDVDGNIFKRSNLGLRVNIPIKF